MTRTPDPASCLSMHPRLSLKNITKRYPGIVANDGINMNAAYGTALLLMVIILAFNLFARFLSRKRR